ncbi:MAG: hypothetical protein ACJA2G_003340, partial [Cognaticolwellia sp.]
MKIQLIAAAISFSLVACVSTEQKQVALDSQTMIASDVIDTDVIAREVLAKPSVGATRITLEKIMANPDWFG